MLTFRPFPDLSSSAPLERYIATLLSPPRQTGDGLYISGTLTASSSTFSHRVGSEKDLLHLTTSATASFQNCTFNAAAGTPAAVYLIYASGVTIDYGSCAAGMTPGEPAANILVSDGNFTGCPFGCSPGTFGPGGDTAVLRDIESGCGVGCRTCPRGAVCDVPALPAPINCTAGHYNPDEGSQTSGSCRLCSMGSFQAGAAATACVACTAGKFSAEEGSTACSECGAGGYCEEVGASSASVFQLCAPGTWSDTFGLNSRSGCRACGQGTHQPLNGANSSSACIDCLPGSFTDADGRSACTR